MEGRRESSFSVYIAKRAKKFALSHYKKRKIIIDDDPSDHFYTATEQKLKIKRVPLPTSKRKEKKSPHFAVTHGGSPFLTGHFRRRIHTPLLSRFYLYKSHHSLARVSTISVCLFAVLFGKSERRPFQPFETVNNVIYR